MTRAREHLDTVLRITIGISFFLVSCIITLISLWASDDIDTVEFPEGSTQLEGIVGNPSGLDFLGIPDWNNNLIAYHAAIMVGGYFVAQMMAIVSWCVFSSFGMSIAKIAHVFFITIALGAVISGLVAVISLKYQTQEAHLASVHSWLGVMAVIVFGGNYTYGLAMWGYKIWRASPSNIHPPSAISSATGPFSLVDYRLFIHRALGASAFVFSAMAVVTGVMNQLVGNICENPASNGAIYLLLPDGCKVGNGLGIVVALSTVTTLFCVLLRATIKRENKVLVTGRTARHQQEEEEETIIDVDGGEKWLSESERRKKRMKLMYSTGGVVKAGAGTGAVAAAAAEDEGHEEDKETESFKSTTSANPLRHLEVLI